MCQVSARIFEPLDRAARWQASGWLRADDLTFLAEVRHPRQVLTLQQPSQEIGPTAVAATTDQRREPAQ